MSGILGKTFRFAVLMSTVIFAALLFLGTALKNKKLILQANLTLTIPVLESESDGSLPVD